LLSVYPVLPRPSCGFIIALPPLPSLALVDSSLVFLPPFPPLPFPLTHQRLVMSAQERYYPLPLPLLGSSPSLPRMPSSGSTAHQFSPLFFPREQSHFFPIYFRFLGFPSSHLRAAQSNAVGAYWLSLVERIFLTGDYTEPSMRTYCYPLIFSFLPKDSRVREIVDLGVI